MSSTRKRTTANTTTFEYDQKHARTKRATQEASKRMSDAATLEDIKKLKTDVILLTSQQVKHQGIMRQSIVKHKMKNSTQPPAEIQENREQQMKYTGLIKKTKDKIASLEKSLSSKGGRRKRKRMKKTMKKK
jgi:tRNA U34 5-carboxymethylaminomethyl modifying enzyme MnmG/GidA